MKDIKTPNVSRRWEGKEKTGKKKANFHSMDYFHGWEPQMPNFCGPAVGEKRAVGSEPMLAFLLQFLCPIRKLLRTHGKLEKEVSF